jgi:hypothetical protein
MSFVPVFISGKFALHFFPDRLVLTDNKCKQELVSFKLNEVDFKNLREWFNADF